MCKDKQAIQAREDPGIAKIFSYEVRSALVRASKISDDRARNIAIYKATVLARSTHPELFKKE